LPAGEATSIFEIEKFEPPNLNSSEEPGRTYLWAQYLGSASEYKADNYDNNTHVREKVYLGNFEAAAGYWFKQSDYGALLTGSTSMFRTVGRNHSFSDASLSVGYRIYREGSPHRFRVWLGLAYKEVPEVLIDPDSFDVYVAKTKIYAPKLRAVYLFEVNPTLGCQLQASYLDAAHAIETVNHAPLNFVEQFSLGASLTYRLAPEYMVRTGYTYQLESASYHNVDTTNPGTNQFSFKGHYLSVAMLIGLDKRSR
jgi:hypothetical protein